jgi:hypothetical protein
MAETGNNRNGKERSGYLVAAVTIVVSVVSLYFSGVQARLASKGFELSLCSSTANLDKQVAELTKTLADRQKELALGDCLTKLAQLQDAIAERQAQFGLQADRGLVDLQKHVAQVEQEVGHLQQDRDAKAHEAETLRARVAELEHPPAVASNTPDATHHFVTSTAELLRQRLHPHPKAEPAAPAPWPLPEPARSDWKRMEPPAPNPNLLAREADRSLWGQGVALLNDLWEVIKKHVAVSIYFGLALLFILGKLFGSK